MIVQELSERALSDQASQLGVEFARFLSRLEPGVQDTILAAGYLAACAVEDAHTCLDLNEQTLFDYMEEKGLSDLIPLPKLLSSKLTPDATRLIGAPGQKRPLIVCNNRIYINRYWAAEEKLARKIKEMATRRFELSGSVFDLADRLFPPGAVFPDWQKLAGLNGCRSRFSVISGGPGTGKTRTVAALMALMIEAWPKDTPPQIALCAPTGKAVARLNESISAAVRQLDIPSAIRESLPQAPKTVHRLLGRGRNAATYRYNAETPLPFDVIIVDEASMLDLTMMSRLVDAMAENARLILIGDQDQLASVEAGSVLSDICWAASKGGYSHDFMMMAKRAGQDISGFSTNRPSTLLSDCMVVLRHNYRFGKESGIHRLAKAVNQGDLMGAEGILEDPNIKDALFLDEGRLSLDSLITDEFKELADLIWKCKVPEQALGLLDKIKVLCATNEGPTGTKAVNEFVSRRFFSASATRPYHGLPVIIRQNDYNLGLFNGDTGIIWDTEPDSLGGTGGLKAWFVIEGEPIGLSTSRLPRFEPAWAITVHVSQGSEFDRVLFLLPQAGSVMAGRELFYTAITRARKSIAIYGSKSALTNCVKRPTLRMSGLKEMLL